MGRPLGTIVEVEPFKKENEVSGFVISVDNEHLPEKGRVINAGSDVKDIKIGDEILFKKGAYSKVTINGKEVLLLEEKSVYYIL